MSERKSKGFQKIPKYFETEGRKRPKRIKRTGTAGPEAKFEQLTGVSRNDPNFRYAVENALANESSDVRDGNLLLLGFKKPKPKFRKMESTFLDHISKALDKD